MNSRIDLWSSAALVALLSLSLAGPAQAAVTTVVSPELSVLGGDTAVCRIVNAGTTQIAVKIQLVTDSGNVTAEENVNVLPGKSGIAIGEGFSGGGARCQFIGQFNKSLVRASIDLVDAGFRTTVISPAQ